MQLIALLGLGLFVLAQGALALVWFRRTRRAKQPIRVEAEDEPRRRR